MKNIFKMALGAALGALVVFSLGCDNHHSSSDDDTPSGPRPLTDKELHQMVDKDLSLMTSPKTAGLNQKLQTFDKNSSNYLSKVFGGPTASDFHHFFNDRIRFFLTMNELNKATVQPASFRYTGWTKEPRSRIAQQGSGLEIGAFNGGALLWLMGVIDGTTTQIQAGDLNLQLTSSRVGLMVIGPGYKDSMIVRSRTIPVPSEYRQSILIHEARHSDCTGGLTEADLEPIRKATDRNEFDRTYKRHSCGHLHRPCPPGHDLAGLKVCDQEIWGAYVIGALFLSAQREAMDRNQPDSDLNGAIMDSLIVDSWSRAPTTRSEILSGRKGEPDMSHQEFKPGI